MRANQINDFKSSNHLSFKTSDYFLYLQEVYWPSITVCNLNQVEASYWKSIGAYANVTVRNEILEKKFGSKYYNQINDKDYFGISDFTETTRQRCKNLFIEMSFRGKYMAWSDLPYDKRNESEENKIGPAYYPTDFGACCLFVPHLDFEPFDKSLPFEQLYHDLNADSLNGENNGLKLVLDAEQFNYALKSAEGAGFKLSLHHHSDKPMTQFSTQLINSGQGFMNKF